MGISNEGTVCGWVPFTRMETGLPQDCPLPAETDRIQDSHNVAMTRSTDTQSSGNDTPRWEP